MDFYGEDRWLTAGVTGKCGIWQKKAKGKPAFGAESHQVWATPALVRCKRCWAHFDYATFFNPIENKIKVSKTPSPFFWNSTLVSSSTKKYLVSDSG